MHIELYSRADCKFCDMARNALKSGGIPFTEKKLGTHFTRERLLEDFPTAKTFPIVVVDGFYIGGYTQLLETLQKNSSTSQFLSEGEWNGA
jgi:glutaredoxin 3